VDDVAAAAGVSRPTVFAAVGNKRELIKQARDVALAGDEAPIPMPQRPWVQALRGEPDLAGAVGIYAHAMREIYQRAARLELALAAAAEADPELLVLADTARGQRLLGCQLVARTLADKQRLRHGVNPALAADLLFAIASPDVYRLLVLQRGWSANRYEGWLAENLLNQLSTSGSATLRERSGSR
jgi:AcrR family transcriptional regulator